MNTPPLIAFLALFFVVGLLAAWVMYLEHLLRRAQHKNRVYEYWFNRIGTMRPGILDAPNYDENSWRIQLWLQYVNATKRALEEANQQ